MSLSRRFARKIIQHNRMSVSAPTAAAVPATFRNTHLMKRGQAPLQSIMKNCLSAIIAVTDLIPPTPTILTGIGTLAWHRRSIWRCRPTPLKSFLRNTEVSVRLFVVRQIPAPSFPKENILPRPVFGTKKRSRIWTRILLLADLFKMNARLVRALPIDMQPSARRVGR
jgi:hypothetical protein